MQVAIRPVDGEMKRADLARRVRARIPSDDHELLLVDRLDLEPLLRSPRLVAGRQLLGHDSFVAGAGGALQRDLPRSLEPLGEAHPCRRTTEQFLQQATPLLVALLAQIGSIEPEDIEEKHQLAFALLKKLKARDAVLVESDDLAIEHHLSDHQVRHRFGDLRESSRQIELVATPHGHFSIDERRERAEAVVLHLVGPVLFVAWRLVGQRGQHRRKHTAKELLGVPQAQLTRRTSSNPSATVGGASFFEATKIATSGTRAFPSRWRLRVRQTFTVASK